MINEAPFQLTFGREAESFADPKISIAMATYNGGKYLAAQLESIKIQTKPPYELVIVDDGSADNTLDIVKNFSEAVPFQVRHLKNEINLGYQRTFLKAAAYCKGDLIAFCDQDDIWMPEKLEVCVRHFQNPEILLCFHMGEVWYGKGRSHELAQKFDSYGIFDPFSFDPLKSVLGFSMVLRKSLFGIISDIPLPNSIYNVGSKSKKNMIGHDGIVWFLASVFGKIIIIREILVLYRQHEGNTVGKDRSVKLLGQLRHMLMFLDLEVLISLEREYILFLEKIGLHGTENVKSQAKKMTEILSERISFHEKRAELYGNKDNFFIRVTRFFNLLSSSAYAKNYCFDQFNRYARTKDLIFGVLRLGGVVKFLTNIIKQKRKISLPST